MKLKVGFFERPLPFHLLLAPMTLPLALISANLNLFSVTTALPSIVVGCALALSIWLVLIRITMNARASAIVITLMTFGFILDFVIDSVAGRASLAGALVMWFALLALSLIVLRFGGQARAVTVCANTFFLIVCASFCLNIGVVELTRSGPRVIPGYLEALPIEVTRPPATLPDVYIFVLDGYARADVLREVYGYDDTLARHLRAVGFEVAEDASSNYAFTGLSLASSLNLDYLTALIRRGPPDPDSREDCQTLIAQNRTFHALRRAGYRVVTFASEYSMVRFDGADKEYAPPFYLTDFGYALYEASAFPRFSTLVGLPPSWLPHQVRRHTIQWTLTRLPGDDLADHKRPTFVFAHILLPHPPFVFRASGGYTWTQASALLNEGDAWHGRNPGGTESYKTGYLGNLRFLGDRMTAVIDGILARARRPTAILIQGDHGPGSRLALNDASASDMKERLGILLAVKLPDCQPSGLYPTVTPVNAMRVLLNHVLGAKLPLLDDSAWFSTMSRPYAFQNVTARVR